MKNNKNRIVKLHERVEIVGTGKSQFLPKDATFKVHPLNAEALIKMGKAVYKKEKLE